MWGSTAALVVPLYGVWNVVRGTPGGAFGFGSETVSPAIGFIAAAMVMVGLASVKVQDPKKAQ